MRLGYTRDKAQILEGKIKKYTINLRHEREACGEWLRKSTCYLAAVLAPRALVDLTVLTRAQLGPQRDLRAVNLPLVVDVLADAEHYRLLLGHRVLRE